MVKGMLKVKVKVCSNVVKRGATGYRIRDTWYRNYVHFPFLIFQNLISVVERPKVKRTTRGGIMKQSVVVSQAVLVSGKW